MLPNLGPLELGIILLIVVLIFGAGKLAGVGGALGKSVKEFRDATREDKPAADAAESVAEKAAVAPTEETKA